MVYYNMLLVENNAMCTLMVLLQWQTKESKHITIYEH